MTVDIFNGDCRLLLPTIDAGSINCCVTSSPYFGLRDYGVAGQIGLELTPQDYVHEMVAVFRQVRRVLRDDGTLWLNLGDSYAGSGRGGNPTVASSTLQGSQTSQEKSRVRRGRDEIAATQRQSAMSQRMPGGLKPKDLMGMPWEVASALRTDGWYLRQDIIWSKPNPMPESVADRCTKSHEYLFLLSKSEQYACDMDAIREDRVADEDAKRFRGGCYIAGDDGNSTLGKRRTIGNRRIKVPGGWETSDGAHGTIHKAGRTSGEYQEHLTKRGRNKRSVWTVATQPFKEAHFATFPPDLIEPCIKAGCPRGGTVLDPFGGAGTTGLVADRPQRNAILFELNPQYADMAEQRIHGDAPLFADAVAAT